MSSLSDEADTAAGACRSSTSSEIPFPGPSAAASMNGDSTLDPKADGNSSGSEANAVFRSGNNKFSHWAPASKRSSWASLGARSRRASVESSASTVVMRNCSDESRRHSYPEDIMTDHAEVQVRMKHPLMRRNSAPSIGAGVARRSGLLQGGDTDTATAAVGEMPSKFDPGDVNDPGLEEGDNFRPRRVKAQKRVSSSFTEGVKVKDPTQTTNKYGEISVVRVSISSSSLSSTHDYGGNSSSNDGECLEESLSRQKGSIKGKKGGMSYAQWRRQSIEQLDSSFTSLENQKMPAILAKLQQQQKRQEEAEQQEQQKIEEERQQKLQEQKKDLQDKQEEKLQRRSLTDADYEEFITRKMVSRVASGLTYAERKRRESEHDSFGSSVESIESNLSSIGARSESRATNISNAQLFKYSTAWVDEANGENVVVNHAARFKHDGCDENSSVSHAARFKHEANNENLGRSNAARLKHDSYSAGAGEPNTESEGVYPAIRFKHGVLDSSDRTPDSDQILLAEVQLSTHTSAQREEESYERLRDNDDEESMMSAIDAAWRAGERARLAMSEREDDHDHDHELDDEYRSSLQATLVEDVTVQAIPLEAVPVELDPSVENEAKRRLVRQIVLFYIPIMLLAIVVTWALVVEFGEKGNSGGDQGNVNATRPLTDQTYNPTLIQVKKDRVLRCGVPEEKLGFAKFNVDTGEREGMSVDLCTAVAVIVFGSEYRVELIKVNSITRFTALADRVIDLLIYGDTHTMERDFHEKAAGVGFQFSDPYFYDGLSFAGVPSAVQCADDFRWLGECSDLKICVLAQSTHQDILKHNFPRQKLLPKESFSSMLKSFVDGSCSVIAGEQNDIAQVAVQNAGYYGDYAYGKKILSKEPLAMVTRKNDQSWSDIVNWVLRGLIHAEKNNITQENAKKFLNNNTHSFLPVIEAVGNYGEIWARHIEVVVPRKGLNLLYTDGSNSGLLYSHPFGVIDDFCHEFDPLGTINQIIDRGKLTCGIFGTEYQSIDADFCRALAASLFDSDYSLVDFVELSNDENVLEMLDNGKVDVIAGANPDLQSDLAPSNKTLTGLSGLSLSLPYFYGDIASASRALATSQTDPDWSTFVYWVVTGTIWAEENGVTSKDFQQCPVVDLFGPTFEWMFRGCILGRGNYAEIYNRNIDVLPPRANLNLLNNGTTPQLYPPPTQNEVTL